MKKLIIAALAIALFAGTALAAEPTKQEQLASEYAKVQVLLEHYQNVVNNLLLKQQAIEQAYKAATPAKTPKAAPAPAQKQER